jgi:hypothetical protein
VRLKFQKRSALKFVSRTTKYRLCRDDLMIPKTRENNPAEGGGFNTPQPRLPDGQVCCGISFSRVLGTLGFHTRDLLLLTLYIGDSGSPHIQSLQNSHLSRSVRNDKCAIVLSCFEHSWLQTRISGGLPFHPGILIVHPNPVQLTTNF